MLIWGQMHCDIHYGMKGKYVQKKELSKSLSYHRLSQMFLKIAMSGIKLFNQFCEGSKALIFIVHTHQLGSIVITQKILYRQTAMFPQS